MHRDTLGFMNTPLKNQNDLGTILYWKHENTDIIFPFTQIGDIFRGGMFWCIPNLGPQGDIFAIQNGEYRKCEGRETKILTGVWGALNATVIWNFSETEMTTTATLIATKNNTHLRPGFHPYFPVGHTFEISIGETKLTQEDIPHDTRVIVILKNKESGAILHTNNQTTCVSYHITEGKSDLTRAFCIWTE